MLYKDLQNSPRLLQIYQQRIEIIKKIREFFWLHNFMEVDTPIALKYPGQEPYLNPISVLFHSPKQQQERFYLQTSPEFAMKKLLAVGFKNIFQICKCFRDYESWGGNHNTEFTMIEWYRSGRLTDIMNDVEKLFKFVAKELNIRKLRYKNKEIEMISEWDRKTMKELWQEYIGFDLDQSIVSTEVGIQKLKELCYKFDLQINSDDQYEDLFYKIFLNKIEPFLGVKKPIFVYDYPANVCSLSELCEHDNRYAQRFELYIGGIELANAFGELIDSNKQKINLEQDLNLRKRLNKEIWSIDEDFIKALNDIKQETAGIALGIDRMVLLFTDTNNLNEVIFQAVSDQI